MPDRDPASRPFSPAPDSRDTGVSGGPDTTADRTSPARWLYAGESVVVREPLGPGWVAVTTHRLLVYTPDTDGPTFCDYDRLNVDDVRVDTGGDGHYLAVLSRVAIYAVVLLGGWVGVGQAGLTDLLAVDAGDSLAIVGMAGLFDSIRTAFELLELALLGGGLVLVAVAVTLGGLYLRSRQSRLVVTVSGTGPVTIPLPPTVTARDVRLDRTKAALDS